MTSSLNILLILTYRVLNIIYLNYRNNNNIIFSTIFDAEKVFIFNFYLKSHKFNCFEMKIMLVIRKCWGREAGWKCKEV